MEEYWMNEQSDMQAPQVNQETTTGHPGSNDNRREGATRRELILRYSKYALAAAPFLLFVSKAHAIHSGPPPP